MFKTTRLILSAIMVFVAATMAQAAGTKTYELAPELSYITYKEKGIKETGMMYGLSGAYTYRGSLPIQNLDKAMLKAELRLAGGSLDYDGELQDGTPYKIDNIGDFLSEIRGIAGYDFPFFSTSTITPYFGLGYRYLFDGLAKDPAGYDRESNYLYSPIGFETSTPLSSDWSLGFKAEYDIFWHGWQQSHLSHVGLDDVTNDQEKGYGVRGAIKLRKTAGHVSLIIEPFINYWNIDKSKDAPLTIAGTVVGSAWEPKNNSTEFGLKLGAEF